MAGTSCVILLLLGTLSSALEGQADDAVLQQAESAFVQGLQLRSQPGAAAGAPGSPYASSGRLLGRTSGPARGELSTGERRPRGFFQVHP